MENKITKINQELEEKKKLLKETVCAGATDAELELFINVCNHTGLNPFFKQIYLIDVRGKRTTIISIDGFRLIAERTGRYVPGAETSYKYNDKDELVSATSYIKKLAGDGSWHEFSESALWSEYAKKDGKGKYNYAWASMPHVMLSKCSEARVLRKGFPAEFSGLYAKEELDQACEETTEPVLEVVKPLGQVQLKALSAMISDDVETLKKLLTEFKVEALSDLPAIKFKLALNRVDELQEEAHA